MFAVILILPSFIKEPLVVTIPKLEVPTLIVPADWFVAVPVEVYSAVFLVPVVKSSFPAFVIVPPFWYIPIAPLSTEVKSCVLCTFPFVASE